MSEPIESQVRTAVAARMAGIEPERAARLRAHDYRPRRWRVPVVPTLGAGASGLAAAIVAALLLLSGGTPDAFAGWTSTPSSPSATALRIARQACGDVSTTGVLASEARGPFVALAYVRGGRPWQCVVRGEHVVVKLATRYPTRVYATVPADKVMLPQITQQAFGPTVGRIRSLQRRDEQATNDHAQDANGLENALLAQIAEAYSGPSTVSVAIGLAGARVRGVTFVLHDGTRIQATVEHGWYVAWWPGAAQPGGGTAKRVAVKTSGSTRSAPLPAPLPFDTAIGSRPCDAGPACVIVPLRLAARLPGRLTRSFALFDNRSQVTAAAEPTMVRQLARNSLLGLTEPERELSTGASLGIDPHEVHRVQLTPAVSVWVLPGSEGFCEAQVDRRGGGTASCGPLATLLRRGATFLSYGGSVSWVAGFVPDGNSDVTVHFLAGAAVKVPVRRNTFKASFRRTPESVTFRNAYGKTVAGEFGP